MHYAQKSMRRASVYMNHTQKRQVAREARG